MLDPVIGKSYTTHMKVTYAPGLTIDWTDEEYERLMGIKQAIYRDVTKPLVQRIVDYIRHFPGCSIMEISRNLPQYKTNRQAILLKTLLTLEEERTIHGDKTNTCSPRYTLC